VIILLAIIDIVRLLSISDNRNQKLSVKIEEFKIFYILLFFCFSGQVDVDNNCVITIIVWYYRPSPVYSGISVGYMFMHGF